MVVKAKYAENMCRCANFRYADVEIVTLVDVQMILSELGLSRLIDNFVQFSNSENSGSDKLQHPHKNLKILAICLIICNLHHY
jgi:hypothetical protein